MPRYDDQSSSVTLTPDLLVVTGDEDHDGQPESPRYLPADLHLTPYEWTHLELAVDSHARYRAAQQGLFDQTFDLKTRNSSERAVDAILTCLQARQDRPAH